MQHYLHLQNSIMTTPALLFCLLLAVQGSQAFNPATNTHTALKFNFLPLRSESVWGPFVRGENATCGKEYQTYLKAWQVKDWHAAADGAYDTSNCILNGDDEMKKKTSDSAAILLGLAPILFSTLGPSLTEIGLISIQRPFLALLFSLGTASIYPSRAFKYTEDDATEILTRKTVMDKSVSGWLKKQYRSSSGSKKRQWLLIIFAIGIAQYLVIAAAAFNIIYTSWQLGVASIYIPDSPASFYPMAWTLSPLVIHLFASGAMLLSKRGKSKSARQKAPRKASRISRIGSWCKLQFLPSFMHPRLHVGPTRAMILTHNFATALAVAQVFFGVMVFSSLLFISLADAAVILLRYLISLFVCRAVLAFELGGIDFKESKNALDRKSLHSVEPRKDVSTVRVEDATEA